MMFEFVFVGTLIIEGVDYECWEGISYLSKSLGVGEERNRYKSQKG